PTLVSTGDAEYAITVRLLRGSLDAGRVAGDTVSLDFRNRASALREPVLETSTATVVSHRARFLPSGLANEFEMAVPDAAKALVVRARSGDATEIPIELYLYDCTSGECFSYDIAFPAARSQVLIVRKPRAGRWIAAVNAAPFPTADGDFAL